MIGVLPLAGTFVPAKAVESFLESFPYANLTLVEGPYASLLRGLRAGEIDLIIGGLSSPASEPDIAHQQLYDEEVMVAVRASHPWRNGVGFRWRNYCGTNGSCPGSIRPPETLWSRS